jgi:hypothetical protein
VTGTISHTKSLHHALKAFQRPKVLLIDEVGYVALRQPECHLLFQVISLRHDRKQPTVITTNRIPSVWNRVFTDNAVAHAILDRLAARAEVSQLEGESYRATHRTAAPKVRAELRPRLPARSARRACWRSGSRAPPHRSTCPSQLVTFPLALVRFWALQTGHFQCGASIRASPCYGLPA